MSRRIGWWLMGLPTGIRTPWRLLVRWGPYAVGAWLANRERRFSGTGEEPQ